jgi:tetratricopeptide (TPR) repeat protein
LSAGPLLNTFMISWLLMWLLPALQLALHYQSVGAAMDDADSMRYIFSEFTALSTIPGSIAGLTIALAKNAKAARILGATFLASSVTCLLTSIYFLSHPSSAYFCRIYVEEITGPASDVIDDCTSAIKLDPHMARVYLARSYAHLQLANLEQALSDCSKAISIDPQDPDFLFVRASIYYKMGAYEDAVSDSSEAIRIRPRFKYYLQRAQALSAFHQYENALADCNRVIELRPESSHGYIFRADNYAKCWQFERAFADLAHAIALNPKNPHAYITRAEAYERTGHSSLAESDRKMAAKLACATKDDPAY